MGRETPDRLVVMTRLTTALAAAAIAGFLAGCSAAPTTAPPTAAPAAANDWLATHNLAGRSAADVVDTLDRDPRPRPLPVRASVTADSVVVTDGTNERTLPLDGDRFYLSIAPYVRRTHECYNHNLGTCQGELVGEEVRVTITDAAGQVLVDSDVTTYANGFVGFWLPRDTTGTVRVERGGLVGEVPIATASDSPTCLTTLQLS